ncbi:hypothetical protein [Streptomyces sp. SAI-127]|nr:hypothetical protein [Streptomyces sp. SAI-127]MDH6491940.1 hypothetical protein [Streptomyces sp. SAI-127]
MSRKLNPQISESPPKRRRQSRAGRRVVRGGASVTVAVVMPTTIRYMIS